MKNYRLIKKITAGVLLLVILFTNYEIPVLGTEVNATQSAEYIPGELLVMYKSSSDSQNILDVAGEEDSNIQTLSEVDDETIALVKVPKEEPIEALIEEYRQNADVIAVTPNYIVNLHEDGSESNDPSLPMQWYMNQISAFKGWDYLNKLKHDKIRVAVLDTGADIRHLELRNVINMDSSKEILDYSGTRGQLKGDDYILGNETSQGQSHGTHVSGVIVSEANNGIGIAGVGTAGNNSPVELMVVDVMSDVNKTNIAFVIRGMEYALEQGAKVINMSLGAIKESGVDDSIYEAEFNKLYQKGITIVCSAGNESINDGGEITAIPSDYPSTISVISVDKNNDKAGTSNYGKLKDLSAPGVNIYSTLKNNAYGYKNGTSMATPMVTAAAAMMYSLNPDITPDEVKKILTETATDIGEHGVDIYTGAGLLNVEQALKAVSLKLPFSDVSSMDWFFNDVSYAYKNRIMTGITENEFGPGMILARAQFATMLYRMEGAPSIVYEKKFPDVLDGEFYTNPVMWASQNSINIIKGYQDGRFGPADSITREQMVVMMYRYAKYKGYDVSESADINAFEDAANVNDFAKEAVEWAVGSGIIQGDQGLINPQGNVYRAVCATIIKRFNENYN